MDDLTPGTEDARIHKGNIPHSHKNVKEVRRDRLQTECVVETCPISSLDEQPPTKRAKVPCEDGEVEEEEPGEAQL